MILKNAYYTKLNLSNPSGRTTRRYHNMVAYNRWPSSKNSRSTRPKNVIIIIFLIRLKPNDQFSLALTPSAYSHALPTRTYALHEERGILFFWSSRKHNIHKIRFIIHYIVYEPINTMRCLATKCARAIRVYYNAMLRYIQGESVESRFCIKDGRS